MTKLAFLALVGLLAAGVAVVTVARLRGRSDSRPAILVSVVSHWLGAWVLWTFAGGLALRYGALSVYDGSLFGLVAAVMGVWHYRTRVSRGPEPGLAVFVGGQLAWLLVVLARNGILWN